MEKELGQQEQESEQRRQQQTLEATQQQVIQLGGGDASSQSSYPNGSAQVKHLSSKALLLHQTAVSQTIEQGRLRLTDTMQAPPSATTSVFQRSKVTSKATATRLNSHSNQESQAGVLAKGPKATPGSIGAVLATPEDSLDPALLLQSTTAAAQNSAYRHHLPRRGLEDNRFKAGVLISRSGRAKPKQPTAQTPPSAARPPDPQPTPGNAVTVHVFKAKIQRQSLPPVPAAAARSPHKSSHSPVRKGSRKPYNYSTTGGMMRSSICGETERLSPQLIVMGKQSTGASHSPRDSPQRGGFGRGNLSYVFQCPPTAKDNPRVLVEQEPTGLECSRAPLGINLNEEAPLLNTQKLLVTGLVPDTSKPMSPQTAVRLDRKHASLGNDPQHLLTTSGVYKHLREVKPEDYDNDLDQGVIQTEYSPRDPMIALTKESHQMISQVVLTRLGVQTNEASTKSITNNNYSGDQTLKIGAGTAHEGACPDSKLRLGLQNESELKGEAESGRVRGKVNPPLGSLDFTLSVNSQIHSTTTQRQRSVVRITADGQGSPGKGVQKKQTSFFEPVIKIDHAKPSQRVPVSPRKEHDNADLAGYGVKSPLKVYHGKRSLLAQTSKSSVASNLKRAATSTAQEVAAKFSELQPNPFNVLSFRATPGASPKSRQAGDLAAEMQRPPLVVMPYPATSLTFKSSTVEPAAVQDSLKLGVSSAEKNAIQLGNSARSHYSSNKKEQDEQRVASHARRSGAKDGMAIKQIMKQPRLTTYERLQRRPKTNRAALKKQVADPNRRVGKAPRYNSVVNEHSLDSQGRNLDESYEAVMIGSSQGSSIIVGVMPEQIDSQKQHLHEELEDQATELRDQLGLVPEAPVLKTSYAGFRQFKARATPTENEDLVGCFVQGVVRSAANSQTRHSRGEAGQAEAPFYFSQKPFATNVVDRQSKLQTLNQINSRRGDTSEPRKGDLQKLMINGNKAARLPAPVFNPEMIALRSQMQTQKINKPNGQIEKQIGSQNRFGVTAQEWSPERASDKLLGRKVPMSNNTSRSPIPIDPETFRAMNMCLPINLDASDHESVARQSKSNSRRSMSPAETNLSERQLQFTQVKQFIMSPQNLHNALKNQRQLILLEQDKQGLPRSKVPPIPSLRKEQIKKHKLASKPNTEQESEAIGNQRASPALVQPITITGQSSLNMPPKLKPVAQVSPRDQKLHKGSNVDRKSQRDTQLSGLESYGITTSGGSQVRLAGIGGAVGSRVSSPTIQQMEQRSSSQVILQGGSAIPPVEGEQMLAGLNIIQKDLLGTSEQRSSIVETILKQHKQDIPHFEESEKDQAQIHSESKDEKVKGKLGQGVELAIKVSRFVVAPQNEDKTKSSNQNQEQNARSSSVMTNNRSANQSSDRTMPPSAKQYEPVLKKRSGARQETSALLAQSIAQSGATQRKEYVLVDESEELTSRRDTSDFERVLRDSKVATHGTPLPQTQTTHDLVAPSRLFGHNLVHLEESDNSRSLADASFTPLNAIASAQFQLSHEASHRGENRTSDSAMSATGTQFLRLDARGLAQHSAKKNGIVDFAHQKALQFLEVQRGLPWLDHNSRASETSKSLTYQADSLLRNIALQPKNGRISPEQSSLYELNQKKQMRIQAEIPTAGIHFKNKSEQQRYIRMAKLVFGLGRGPQGETTCLKKQILTNPKDVEVTYTRIFRFLADTLSDAEFNNLTSYHVSKFISFMLAKQSESSEDPPKEQSHLQQTSLRSYLCQALDLAYEQSSQSRAMFEAHGYSQHPRRHHKGLQSQSVSLRAKQPLWSSRNLALMNDPNSYTQDRRLQQSDLLYSTSKVLQKGAEERHKQIFDKLESQVKTQATEPALPAVVRSSFFKDKETIRRGHLARLLKSKKTAVDLDISSLEQQSTIARNKVMLEHVLAKRNMRDWRDQLLVEIHEEQRLARPVDMTSLRYKRNGKPIPNQLD